MITSEPHRGEIIDVDVPTYVTGTLHYENGAIGTIFTTFDVYYPTQARLEIYGTKGTLIAPDPNYFDGPVSVFSPADGAVKEVPLLFGYRENRRAMGLADMADALENGRDFRPNSDQQLHVLEILTAFEKSSDAGRCHRDDHGLPSRRAHAERQHSRPCGWLNVGTEYRRIARIHRARPSWVQPMWIGEKNNLQSDGPYVIII